MIRKISFKYTLMISFFLVSALTLGIYGRQSLNISEKVIAEIMYKHMQKLVEKGSEILDLSFSGIREASLNLLIDKELYEIVSRLDRQDAAEKTEADKEIKNILQKYFYSYRQINFVSLVMEDSVYGYGNREVMYDESFFQSELYQKIVEQEGGAVYAWLQDGYFALMRMANLSISSEGSGKIHRLDKEIQRPVLVIGMKTQVFQDEIQPLLPEQGAKYMVLAENGRIISHSRREKEGQFCGEEIFRQLQEGIRGEYGAGKETDSIVCQTRSQVTGWRIVAMISKDLMIKEIWGKIRWNLLLFLLLSMVLSGGFLFFLMRRMTGAIDQMVGTVKRVGEGDFSIAAENTNIVEFDYLVHGYNSMIEKLRSLIDENYIIKIRQRESEIAILNTQLNPHFLQNTLNIIQLSNLNGNKEDTGRMIVALSRMLHYTIDSREELKLLREDMEWMKQYIYIMECRYGNEIQISCCVDEEILDLMVPKLFLQPILENSILHAFNERESGGQIWIRGKRDGDYMMFTVQDNGDGMTEEQVRSFSSENTTGYVGIKNVCLRLRLIYKKDNLFQMESRPGEGTKTVIRIPILSGQ